MTGSWPTRQLSALIKGAFLGMSLALLGSCSSRVPDGAGQELSSEDQAIYQMLALELADFIQNGYEAENGMCVAVYRAPDSKPSAVPVAVFQALEEDTAGSVALIPYSTKQCPFDKILETVEDRWLLFASKAGGSASEERNWLAGVTNPALYGWGHSYRVEIEGSTVRVRSLGAVVS